MTPVELRETIRALLSEHIDPPASDAAPLELESFALVVLAEDLERRFQFRVAAREVVPENFGSVEALVSYVARKREGR